jgi:formyltetrahydrofolate deformylase
MEYRLLIDTSDAKGLVYEISKVLYEHNLNIENNAEFVDKEEDKFFMRTVVSGDLDSEKTMGFLDK